MDEALKKFFESNEGELIEFASRLVQTRSYSGSEENAARLVREKMREIGFDEVYIDQTGSVAGSVGHGEKIVMFDSHIDTVGTGDEKLWTHPPFSGEISGGSLYGRGSVDMKSALAASLFAAAAARELNWLEGKTVYITGTVCEEYCDGVSLALLLDELRVMPDAVIICEPSDNVITLGHKGKAQIRVMTHGISSHGSAPENGVNAVYEMAEIIERVEMKNAELAVSGNPHGTLVLSDISCVSASFNAVPSECSIYLDRRTVPGETEEYIGREMGALISGKRASWEVGDINMKSWTGAELRYRPMHEAWEIDRAHALTNACRKAYEQVFGTPPERYGFWDFSTNAVTPVKRGIPTIGFGPGEPKLAHMTDENCEVSKIKEAYRFYAALVRNM
jgi:putative selenium metabolism hydrolase